MDEFEVYFIRHRFSAWMNHNGKRVIDTDTTNKILEEAWKLRFAVIDYEEITDEKEAFNPEAYGDWSAPKKTLNKINPFLKKGGLIAVSSPKPYATRLLIGKVASETKGRLHNFKSYPNYSFKVIPLEFIEEVSIRNYPSLFSKIPRQTTFTRWPSAKATLNRIFKGEKPNLTSIDSVQDFLDASQLEIMCYEWLRTNNHLEFLTLPIGRTLMSIDIAGIDSNSKKVFAQVTFHSDGAAWKVKSLKDASEPNDVLFFFCKGETQLKDEIQFVDINDVFKFFKSSEKGIRFLKQFIV